MSIDILRKPKPIPFDLSAGLPHVTNYQAHIFIVCNFCTCVSPFRFISLALFCCTKGRGFAEFKEGSCNRVLLYKLICGHLAK